MINDDLQYYYSGDGTAAGSLGGAIHANAVANSQDQNVFDNIGTAEALASSEKYRCLYIKNTGAVSYTFGLYISTTTPSTDTLIQFGIGTAAVNTAEQSIINEDTEPSGVFWVARTQEFNPLSIATLAPGDTKSIWIKRIVSADSGGNDADYFILSAVEV